MEITATTDTNIEYAITTIDIEGGLDKKLLEMVTDYCKRHRNSDVLMLLVDLNIVVNESRTGKTWLIADTRGYRQLTDNRSTTLRPREEKIKLQIYLPKKSVKEK